MNYDQLLNYFAERTHVDDTRFSYPGNGDCIIGATNQVFIDSNLRPMSHGETFYWAGDGCDIHSGVEYLTARELFEAPIYGGKSIRQRWGQIEWEMIDGWMSAEDFDHRTSQSKALKMTNERLCELFQAFAYYYWSVPVSYVIGQITKWHPEVSAEQALKVLHSNTVRKYHFYVESEGLEEPEIVTEHLLALDDKDFEDFIAARYDLPYRDCDEETLLRFDDDRLDIPEKQAIIEFGKTELGLDDAWTQQLVDDCVIEQPTALCEGKSWVMGIIRSESYGKIHFRTVEQVKRFRELGTRFFMAMPNPVLRGWKPSEIENPPALPDDIPEKDEDIPDNRKKMDELFAQYSGREKVREQFMRYFSESAPKKKIGPNDPCPCGSGKKYKKCCGR